MTTLTFLAKSASDESVVAGVSGILRRDFSLQVDHAFRRWLIGTFRTGIGFDAYQSTGTAREDERFFLAAALVYKLSRELQFKGEIRQDWLPPTRAALTTPRRRCSARHPLAAIAVSGAAACHEAEAAACALSAG